MTDYKIYRGDVFYIAERQYTGSEQRAGRPAIIVSNNLNNKHSPTVEIVYMTTSAKKDLPTHTTIRSTPSISTALCEQIHTVSVERVERFVCHLTDEEMANVDMCLMISLDLNYDIAQKSEFTDTSSEPEPDPDVEEFNQEPPVYHDAEILDLKAKLDEAKMELACMKANKETAIRNSTEMIIRAETERDIYKRLYEDLLEKVVK